MCNKRKTALRMVPTIILSGALLAGAFMKLADVHPMKPHFTEMGLQPYLFMLGCIEAVSLCFFIYRKTFRLGLLLLTAYFGGAIAAEIPYHQAAIPATVLVLLWFAAFLRQPSLFSENHFITAKH